MIAILVAYNQDLVIGKDGGIPWQGKLRSDMQRFRDLTIGHTVVMGRKTWESLPERFRPLPDRRNVIVSRDPEYQPHSNVFVYHRLGDALRLESGLATKTFVIGGSQVYLQSLECVDKWIDKIYATEVQTGPIDGDTYFLGRPDARPAPWIWEEISRDDHDPDEQNQFPYSFVTYERR